MWRALSVMIGLVALSLPLQGWENHALLTALAIANMPEIQQVEPVKVETLDDFLAAEYFAIAETLGEEETWDVMQVPVYPPRPANLAFRYNRNDKTRLRARFLEAIRVNPNVSFALFVQELPGKKVPGARYLAPSAVTLLPNSLPSTSRNFAELVAGQMVKASDVFTSATDEPDYGLDIKLWSDSGTEFGRRYGFGDQPFGNPKLEYGSQAPFHMGFYHEATVVNWTATQLTHTLPEYRIHLFLSLSRLAFQSGHLYWGWRFAGMGAHYIQDLTQPYHTKVLPGESTFRLIYSGAIDKIGMHGQKEHFIEQASNEHLALEKRAYCAALQSQTPAASLTQGLDDKQFYKAPYVRNILSAQSYDLADQVAVAFRPLMISKKSSCEIPTLPKADALLGQLMKNFGQHTRGFIRAVLPPKKTGK
jgi:hypothetical protein